MLNVTTQNWVRLPLEGAFNVRELGGLPTRGGGQTAWHRILRSDDISRLTDNDVRFLQEYGVSMVIDLRSPSEAAEKADRLGTHCGMQYANIPLMDDADLSKASQMELADNVSMADMYVEMLEHKEAVKRVFDIIADAPDGCVLFHCAAGKDRTGVLAMLLLMLAGADKQDCLNNYIQSYVNLTRDDRYNEMVKAYSAVKHMMESRPEYLEGAYQYVNGFFGGIEGYLESCGVSNQKIFCVRDRLLGKS